MFGSRAVDLTGEDEVAKRLPKNPWCNPPDYEESREVAETIGRLKNEIVRLKFQIKKADEHAKESNPRKTYERFKETETLEEELAGLEGELAEAESAEKHIERHCKLHGAYIYAIGKVY